MTTPPTHNDEALIKSMAYAAYCFDSPNGAGYDEHMQRYWEAHMRAALAVLRPRMEAAEGMRTALAFMVPQIEDPQNKKHTLGAYKLGNGINMAREAIEAYDAAKRGGEGG